MKFLQKVTKEVNVKSVRVDIHVRHEDEVMPYDFPFRNKDQWTAYILVDNGQIVDWPQGATGSFCLKVCDEGTYQLIGDDDQVIATIEQDYVPNSLLPGEYGDYLALEINEEGIITNWPNDPSFEEFQKDED